MLGGYAKNGLAETIDATGNLFEMASLRIIGGAGDNHLQGVARVENCGKSIGGGEEAVLRRNAGEGFQSALGCVAVAHVYRVTIQAIECECGDGVPGGCRRILERLAPDFEPAHRRRVGRAVEEPSTLGITKFLDQTAGGHLRNLEVARVESVLERIEKCVYR